MALLFRLVLVLILMAGSVVMAPARGQIDGVTQITICAEGGTETLTLDARGNPVASHHPCPDCLPGLGTGPLPAVADPQRIAFARALPLPLPRQIAAAGITPIRATARAPPLSA